MILNNLERSGTEKTVVITRITIIIIINIFIIIIIILIIIIVIIIIITIIIIIITVLCRYNAVYFLTNIHERHPIVLPLRRGMGYLLWIQHLIDILIKFL